MEYISHNKEQFSTVLRHSTGSVEEYTIPELEQLGTTSVTIDCKCGRCLKRIVPANALWQNLAHASSPVHLASKAFDGMPSLWIWIGLIVAFIIVIIMFAYS